MQAIRVHQFGEPSVMKLETTPDPEPGQGQVLISVKAAGVNPVDTYVRKGIYGPKEFPYTPGNDCAGIVESVGAGVKNVKPGQRVYTANTITGSYAEKTLAPANRTFALSDKLSFEEGAAIGTPYSTAYRALFDRARAEPAEKILVHGGSGSVGIAAIQLAKNLGLRIFATAGTPEGLDLVKRMGAHYPLNHRSADYLKTLMDLTEGAGVDVILEMLANVNLGKDLTILSKKGRVVVIGSRGPVEVNPREMMSRESEIRGMMMNGATDQQWKATHAFLHAGFDAGLLKPLVGQKFALGDAPKTHEEVLKDGVYGKIVLIP